MIEYTVRVTDKSTTWSLNGKYHREDGPAVECANGDKEWWNAGLWHRTDGPAIEYANGNESWYSNGERHREDGPAVNHAGTKKWYLNGVQYSEEEWQIAVNPQVTFTVAEIESALGYKIKIVS